MIRFVPLEEEVRCGGKPCDALSPADSPLCFYLCAASSPRDELFVRVMQMWQPGDVE